MRLSVIDRSLEVHFEECVTRREDKWANDESDNTHVALNLRHAPKRRGEVMQECSVEGDVETDHPNRPIGNKR